MKHHVQAVETRHLYKFEAIFLRPEKKKFLNTPRSLKYLRTLAVKVWRKHGRKKSATPRIWVIDGAPWSWCEGYSEIYLATKANTRQHIPHNTVEVLLHELVHCIGYHAHGRAFVRKYLQLLVQYGKCDELELRIALRLFNVRL